MFRKHGSASSKRSPPFTSNITVIHSNSKKAASTSKVDTVPAKVDTAPAKMDREEPSKEVPQSEDAHPRPHLTPKDSKSGKDLMISYSHADKEIMLKLRDNLEKYGISVWVDVAGLAAGVDFLSKIGEAIIDCKLFISLLSKSSVKSRYCQDELALAYVSNRAIFPVALEEPKVLHPLMDTGMKLQLASYEWIILGRDPNTFDEQFNKLLKNLKAELLQQESEATPAKPTPKADTGKTSERPTINRQPSRYTLNQKNKKYEQEDLITPDEYWKRNFSTREEVPWEEFLNCFKRDYKDQLDKLMNEEEQEWLFSILKREMEADEDILYRHELLAFTNVDGDYQPMWLRVNEQARESWAMKEVFDMNSSVRVDAIENLGKFRSAAVIDALRDLLTDPDANCRAVAAVSLARTNANDPVTVKFLMKTLNDKDRLVREAGCLALGHLQVKQAVSKLLHMWRNDVISHVREAANVALNQIGGAEVERAMRVTKVLADEIRQLTVS